MAGSRAALGELAELAVDPAWAAGALASGATAELEPEGGGAGVAAPAGGVGGEAVREGAAACAPVAGACVASPVPAGVEGCVLLALPAFRVSPNWLTCCN
ncbi:hypothetical protein GCM10009104_14250 [Marinobacterium maritimum]|uniref:Secreted protein n=1 Tax=Marinobacterium maritimum TaxID=500162 RepID=A0ABP3TDX9_9GAMM